MPLRLVERTRLHEDDVRDNLPERAVVHTSVCFFDKTSRADPVSPELERDQRHVRVPSPQTNDHASVRLTPRRIVRDIRNRRVHNHPASDRLGLTFAAVWLFAVSRPPYVRVNATDNGDTRRGVCGSRVRDVSPLSAASVGLPGLPVNGFVK